MQQGKPEVAEVDIVQYGEKITKQTTNLERETKERNTSRKQPIAKKVPNPPKDPETKKPTVDILEYGRKNRERNER